MPGRPLLRYTRQRDALLRRVTEVLERDERIVGLWLTGSYGRGDADGWSDFDLAVAVDDAHFADVLAERQEIYAAIGEVILVQPEMPSDALDGGTYQLVCFSGPFHVDWNFGPAGKARKALGHQTLFEKHPFLGVAGSPLDDGARREKASRWNVFFWAMAPIAIKYAGRGETALSIRQARLLSDAFIHLWYLSGQDCDSDQWRPHENQVLSTALERRLPRLARVLTPARVLRHTLELCAEVNRLQVSLEAMDASVPTRMFVEVEHLARIAESEIRRGRFPPRKYR